MEQGNPLMLLHCPHCGSDYDPEQWKQNEVPRCEECEHLNDLPAGQGPQLEAVYRSDLLQTDQQKNA